MGTLEELGWDARREAELAPFAARGLAPARVAVAHRGACVLYGPFGEAAARPAGRLRPEGSGEAERLAVGDWVAAEVRGQGLARVEAVLPRRTALVRRGAGREPVPQVLAANLDVLFLVVGLDGDFNPRRVERTLVLASESGARPVVLLNKADACADLEDCLRRMRQAALGVEVHAVSALRGEGLEALAEHIRPGLTVALIGSSGAGKSTLVNRLLGEERQTTAAVRAHDSRGRHATTRRELFVLPGGGVLVDTPGLRELQLWAPAGAERGVFPDLEELSRDCRFADCRHGGEPGCAVARAVQEGRLEPGRLASFHKLQAELRHAERQHDALARREEERRWRSIHKLARRHRPRE